VKGCRSPHAPAEYSGSSPFPPKKNLNLGPEMATTMQTRIITIEDLRREIREYGVSRLAREIGYCRQYVQRIVGGQRNPSARFLAKLDYVAVTVYKDLNPPTNQQ